ncbi:MAG: cupin domain-containing protein [Thermoanaerobaculia bacterium]
MSVKHQGFGLVVVSVLSVLAAAATAQAPEAEPASEAPHVMLTPAEMEWAPIGSLPPGAMASVVEGDLAQEGFFAARLKLPANYRIPPHFHPAVERVTVLQGTFQLGMGDAFDEAALEAFEPGSYLSMPIGSRHFAATGDEEVIVQLASIGPWGITYVNPADDPRQAAAE